jgi:hypothetical protein
VYVDGTTFFSVNFEPEEVLAPGELPKPLSFTSEK